MRFLPALLGVAAPLTILLGCAGPAGLEEETVSYTRIELSALREEAVTALLELGADPAPQIRANALEALARGAPGRLDPLLGEGLSDENEGVRAVAAMVVAKAKRPGSVPRLRELLNDESVWVRLAAIYALWELGEQVDPSELAVSLLSGPPRQRAQAAFLLGEMGDPTALPLLADAASRKIPLASPNEVQMFLLQVDQARVKLGRPEYVQPIRAALYPTRSEQLELTVLAVQLLGELGDRAAVGELINLTARLDGAGRPMPAEVQIAAAEALARLGNRRGAFIIREHIESESEAIRAQAALALGVLGDPANLPAIQRLMEDPSALVRTHAAGAAALLTRSLPSDRMQAAPETAGEAAS